MTSNNDAYSNIDNAAVIARRYGANRQAAIWVSAAFLTLGGAVVLLSFWALDPTRRLHYLRESAVEYISREEWRQAALQLGNIVQVAPADADAWRELGLVQLREATADDGERFLQDAVSSLRRAADLAPNDSRPVRWLLELELRTGNAQQAREHGSRLAELDPKHPMLTTAWDALPSSEMESAAELETSIATKDGAEKAAAFCRDRFHAQPQRRDPELARVFVESLTKLQCYAERDRFLNELAARYPASKRLLCLRAECALLDGDVGGAVIIASKAVDGPMAATAHGICAEAFLRWAAAEPSESLHHFGRAFEHLQLLADLAPKDESVIARLALVEGESLGRAEAALQVTKTSLDRTTAPSAELLEAHGRLLAASGRTAEAMSYLESATAAKPSARNWQSFSNALWTARTNHRINATRRDGNTVGGELNGN